MQIDDRRVNAAGFTLIELLIVISVIAIVAAIALPSLVRARVSANETSAIGSIRAIASGQLAFSTSCGSGGYASSLAALSTGPPSGTPFISPDVAAGTKSGYTLTVAAASSSDVVAAAATTCNTTADSVSSYFATATPVVVGMLGQRAFATSGVGIYQNGTGAAIADPIPSGTAMLQ